MKRKTVKYPRDYKITNTHTHLSLIHIYTTEYYNNNKNNDHNGGDDDDEDDNDNDDNNNSVINKEYLKSKGHLVVKR